MSKTLYVDIHGTLAKFYENAKCIERMHTAGFYENLLPYEAMVAALKMLISVSSHLDLQIAILSAVDSEQERAENARWIAKWVNPEMPVLFSNYADGKAAYLANNDRTIGPDDYLLDDYSYNLVDWASHGGTAIKFFNELNGRGWNGHHFAGPGVDGVFWSPRKIASTLLRLMGYEENLDDLLRLVDSNEKKEG